MTGYMFVRPKLSQGKFFFLLFSSAVVGLHYEGLPR